MKKREFLKKIGNHLKEHGFKLVFYKRDYVNNCGMKCGGIFKFDKKELSVARGNPMWFEITLHEYCHFLQYVENSKVWNTYRQFKGRWWRWVLKYPGRVVNKKECFNAARNLELDCERRVINLINEYKIPVNPEEYALKANAMIFKYKYFDLTRNYGNLDYDKNEIFRNMMPRKMLPTSKYNVVPLKYKKFLDNNLQDEWNIL